MTDIKKFYKENTELFVAGAIILLSLLTFYIFYFATRFEKTITVKDKQNIGQGGRFRNVIIDSEGNVYRTSNTTLLLFFNSYEIFAGIETGKTYKIKGYGIRFMNELPNIISVEKAD